MCFKQLGQLQLRMSVAEGFTSFSSVKSSCSLTFAVTISRA